MFRQSLTREIEELRQSDAYRTYERVRDEVLRMKERRPVPSDLSQPSLYWEEELRNVDYILDASPLVVAKLRQHAYHLTGVWAYNYRTGKAAVRQRHVKQLQALHALGCPELLVHESPILGGFGFQIDGGLVNADTLKFYEVLIAMQRADLLDTLLGRNKTVVEIGGGWGGLAYQLKTLFPGIRCIIVDLPEVLLYSAVYLMTAFPAARAAFWHPDTPEGIELQGAEFIFVSHNDYRSLPLKNVDLGVNTVSFQEMTTRQVESYVEWLYQLGAPSLYSLNRDRGAYNPELTSVREIISRWFWLRGIPVLPCPYNVGIAKHAGALTLKTALLADDGRDGYRHVLGRRKLLI